MDEFTKHELMLVKKAHSFPIHYDSVTRERCYCIEEAEEERLIKEAREDEADERLEAAYRD